MKLEMKKGIDILSEVGGIKTIDEAKKLIYSKCDEANLAKIKTITNEEALIRIANSVSMFQPDSIWINSASAEDFKYAKEMAIKNGEEFALNLPNHSCHHDLPEDQGRLVSQTFYIANDGEDISSMAKQEPRAESLAYAKKYMPGMMKGRQMLIAFWNRGPVGAAAAIPAIMITDSFYVIHSGNLLYPTVFSSFDKEVARAGVFFTNNHSMGDLKSENIPLARIYMDRSWRTTYSTFCTYAGNTLMLKKGNHRFHVDYSVYEKTGEQLSEHMFLTGLTGPNGRKTFFAGAAPSGCGKTTTAMVGTDFIGDDLAQMWIEKDGSIHAVNPEIGLFGIVKDVNREGDPLLMKALRGDKPAEVIYSNILVTEDGTARWEGDGDPIPAKGKNYAGDWTPDSKEPMSNANARCTLSNSVIENYNQKMATDPAGVEVKVVTYSGRDSDTMPPVWAAKNPDQGVAIGASILSAATATEVGAKGVSRQPWANTPFIPGSQTDYMDSQFKFYNNPKLVKKPVMAGLNYFLTHGSRGGEAGDKRLLGEKRDVLPWLTWLERRANGDVKAIVTPIGYIPQYADLKAIFAETIKKDYSEELYVKHFSFYVDNMIARLDLQTEAWNKEKNCPAKIFEVYKEQKAGLEALKAKFGSIVTPKQLEEVGGLN